MKVANSSDVRKNFKKYLDQSREDHEPIIITTANKEDMILTSREDYESLSETIHLLSSRANGNRLFDSIKQYEDGKTTSFTLDELNGEK